MNKKPIKINKMFFTIFLIVAFNECSSSG